VKDYKGLLVSFVEVVVFLLGAFGGFLADIAPPDETGVGFDIGVLSFFVLIALLITSGMARSVSGKQFRKLWLIAGCVAFLLALPPAFLYPRALNQFTWWDHSLQPAVHRLRGSDEDFKPPVKQFLKDHPDQRAPEQITRDFDRLDQIWTEESIARASTKLRILYIWLVLALCISIFCLLEANVSPTQVDTLGHA